eukprot:CAMPEP_0197863500 /NCGR_PEP_ID=MMETSP1438-20131217/40985_1 /TAXON_ID=1461541 /ORGANISM="Pterosperma sp., Strain CCMP1384" /LENGTH=189 /DNA_ID=CAMNT_0043481411 /DNA_START=264 /DNA_END=831 /DNA_ORIENTATION=-
MVTAPPNSLPTQGEDGSVSSVSEENSVEQGSADDLQCVAVGNEVTCITDQEGSVKEAETDSELQDQALTAGGILGLLALVSPFFFWGTSMVAMKQVLVDTGPFFVASVRLVPAGALLVAFAAAQKRPMPSTAAAWGAITAFSIVDAAMFQGFLAEGLTRTAAGLGSVIIDSQPITVAILAALLYGERIG